MTIYVSICLRITFVIYDIKFMWPFVVDSMDPPYLHVPECGMGRENGGLWHGRRLIILISSMNFNYLYN